MPSDPPPSPRRIVPLGRAAAWVRRYLVGLLIASYAAAAVVPVPGVALQRLGLRDVGVAPITFSLVMVGILLFCGAVAVDLTKLRELPERPGGLALALAGVWLPSLLVIAFWSQVAPAWLSAEHATALAVGLSLAGAMPVANSAVAWTHQSGGSLVWALGLVVLSICLCPWIAPLVMQLMGLTLSGPDATEAEVLMARFTGAVFVLWVLGPTLLGFVVRAIWGDRKVSRARPTLTLLSAGALLLLNYANAATALPSIVAEPDWRLLATALVAAATLPLLGSATGWVAARWARVSRRVQITWAYSLGMKNTGLALGLAGATLGDRPVMVLVILAVTLTQHAVAGIVHALVRRSTLAASER